MRKINGRRWGDNHPPIPWDIVFTVVGIGILIGWALSELV